MPGVKISNLQDGAALRDTDAFPVARGGVTRKILGSQLLTPDNFIVASTPTIGLNWNSSTKTLQASATSAVTAFNTINSPTVNLNWNSATRTLSANVVPNSVISASTNDLLSSPVSLQPGTYVIFVTGLWTIANAVSYSDYALKIEIISGTTIHATLLGADSGDVDGGQNKGESRSATFILTSPSTIQLNYTVTRTGITAANSPIQKLDLVALKLS